MIDQPWPPASNAASVEKKYAVSPPEPVNLDFELDLGIVRSP
jgi:hypothetical protein